MKKITDNAACLHQVCEAVSLPYAVNISVCDTPGFSKVFQKVGIEKLGK